MRAFNVFQYLTLRAVLACMTALVISFVIGPRMIRKLTAYQDRPVGARRRSADASRQGRHADHGRRADPGRDRGHDAALGGSRQSLRLGGADRHRSASAPIGWVDDYRKVVHRNPKGLSARGKLFWQSVIGIVAAMYLAFAISAPDTVQSLRLAADWVASGFSASLPPNADLIVPFFKTVSYPLGAFGFIALTYFVIVGTSNAVNLTDGLDGLAIMPTVMIGALARHLRLRVRATRCSRSTCSSPTSRARASWRCSAARIAGAGLGFLWFNAYPAEVFMGDVGALALGAALGTVAVIVRQEIVLFIMGGVFVVETLSVMLQVASFKLTGKRIFRMAPLHHHYELKGWKENQVVVRFWIITMMLVLFGCRR